MPIESKRKWWIWMVLIAALLCSGGLLLLFYNGIPWFNNPDRQRFPVRGVDVSAYQGEIDFSVLSKQQIDFVFIKATEGSTHVDRNFRINWDNALQNGLLVGAYHFFSYDSPGEEQAKNFINTVPLVHGTLPPVVDLEFYGSKVKNPPDKREVDKILKPLLLRLKIYYENKTPIIYATAESYQRYLKDDYREYPIWIRDIFFEPTLPDQRQWLFWQYSSRKVLKGYQGQERFIDMNAFAGSKEELQKLTEAGK